MPKQPNGQLELVPALQGDFDLVIAGEKIDGRTIIARYFKQIGNDLVMQIGDITSPSEKIMLRNAATLTILCEQDQAALIKGENIDQENYRRNVQALRSTLIGLGLAKKSRDVTKSDSRLYDQHAAAVLDAD